LLAPGDEIYPNKKMFSIKQAVCPDLYKAQNKNGNLFKLKLWANSFT
jgi:hypothetical protein